MEEFDHFSHDHPLATLFEDYEEVDDNGEDPKPYFCSICGLPILCSPSYTCSINDCKFFLHKPCAQLPRRLKHPRYHPINDDFPHALRLVPNDESPRNFTYKCESKDCKFSLHPLVAGAVEIKIKHKSHQSHPLVTMSRETLSLCDACGEEQRGFFFTCQECKFWIHPDCTLLSSYLKIESDPHPLTLMYSLSQFRIKLSKCQICKREALMNIGFYYCGECDAYAHVSCAKSDVDNLESETRAELIRLPPNDDEGNTYPSLVIRRYIERINADHHPGETMLTIEKYHKHPNLILHHDDGISNSSCTSSELACRKSVCDVCIQPVLISSPFYTCQLQSKDECCHVLVHNICANLLSSINFSNPSSLPFYKLFPCPDPSKYVFDSVFPCIICHRPCNGFCCEFPGYDFFVDLECLVAPATVKHAAHGQHVLIRTTRGVDSAIPLNCCSYPSFYHDVYTCLGCDFYIHVGCSLLPKRAQHKFDEHPLELITLCHNNKSSNIDDEYCCFCEFCEQYIDQQYWYYGCLTCENYFHINCIPSVGYLSKVKFGGTHVDDKIHRHPLTLTRMLTIGRPERCGYCQQIIQGFVDQMAFRCCQCDFWIHFSCARDSSCAPQLTVYWEIQEETEQALRKLLNRGV